LPPKKNLPARPKLKAKAGNRPILGEISSNFFERTPPTKKEVDKINIDFLDMRLKLKLIGVK